MSAIRAGRDLAPGICPGCGWAVLSALPCPRCAFLAASPQRIGHAGLPEPEKPLTKQEQLYLAALLLRAEAPSGDPAWHMALTARMLTRRLTPPTPFAAGSSHVVEPAPASVDELPPVPAGGLDFTKVPIGTSPAVLRAYLKRLAAAWRAAECPL